MAGCVEPVVERDLPLAETIIEIERRAGEDGRGAESDVADRRIGHDVADVMRHELATHFDERQRIPRVLADQNAVLIEREADVRIAVWILQVLPAEMLQRARGMKAARKQVEDRSFITRLVRA